MPRGTRKSNDEPTRGKKRPSASHTEDYLSDDGFVADGPHDGGPKKKAKTATDKPRAPQAKGKSAEEESWELTDKRRVQISEFKGMQMVAIREFYEKDGEMLPAKKGISLTVPQYNALVALLPQIETSLTAKGESVVRPDYEGTAASVGARNKTKRAETAEEETDGEGGGDEVKTGAKKNFEATSEEEDAG